MTDKEISYYAIRFVEYCNPHQPVWDTKMYNEKREFIKTVKEIFSKL